MTIPLDEEYTLADKLFDEGRYQESFDLFMKLAKMGDGKSMTRVALAFSEALGVSKDIDKAIEWDMRAIECGETASLLNLALTYCSKRDYRTARTWFEKAVASGDADAALELAKLMSVSDKERAMVRELLQSILSAGDATQASIDEAAQLLDELNSDSIDI